MAPREMTAKATEGIKEDRAFEPGRSRTKVLSEACNSICQQVLEENGLAGGPGSKRQGRAGWGPPGGRRDRPCWVRSRALRRRVVWLCEVEAMSLLCTGSSVLRGGQGACCFRPRHPPPSVCVTSAHAAAGLLLVTRGPFTLTLPWAGLPVATRVCSRKAQRPED